MGLRRLLGASAPLTIVATALTLAATILPADASQGNVCTTFGAQLCIGDPGGPFIGDQMVTVDPPGHTMVFGPGPGGTGVIRFYGFELCGALPNANSLNVKVENCNARGVSFTWKNGPNGHYFVNVLTGDYLTGFDVAGGVLAVCPHPCPGGGEQQWTGP